MSAQPKPESTAVTRAQGQTPARSDHSDEAPSASALQRYEQLGNLAPTARAEVQRARIVREVADMVALTEWGAKMSPVGRAAMAKWCLRRDVDPINEIDNVGGPYINADYYQRKLGELRIRGVVRDVEQINVARDARLEALAKDQNAPAEDREWAAREHYRRLRLRATYGVPEEATGACLTLIHLAAGGDPVPGVKWGGGGTSVRQPRSGGGSAPNPVVEANPVLSVESQSIRRAMRQLAMMLPSVLPELNGAQEELKEIRTAAVEATDNTKALPRSTAEEPITHHAVATPEYVARDEAPAAAPRPPAESDVYGFGTTDTVQDDLAFDRHLVAEEDD